MKSQLAEQEQSRLANETTGHMAGQRADGEMGETAEECAAPDLEAWSVVLAYFREFRTAPAAFADELRSLVREFGLTREISVSEI